VNGDIRHESVVRAGYLVDAPADAKVELQQMVDSIDIEP